MGLGIEKWNKNCKKGTAFFKKVGSGVGEFFIGLEREFV